MANAFKFAAVHFARPNDRPNPLQISASVRVDLPLRKKTVENQDRAAGPSWATVRWAVVGRGPLALGRLAAGLFLAKPSINGGADNGKKNTVVASTKPKGTLRKLLNQIPDYNVTKFV